MDEAGVGMGWPSGRVPGSARRADQAVREPRISGQRAQLVSVSRLAREAGSPDRNLGAPPDGL